LHLLTNGFALLGIACSDYLLIRGIDLFISFLLIFFVDYVLGNYSGGRMTFDLVYNIYYLAKMLSLIFSNILLFHSCLMLLVFCFINELTIIKSAKLLKHVL
jgi:hypothetical protein